MSRVRRERASARRPREKHSSCLLVVWCNDISVAQYWYPCSHTQLERRSAWSGPARPLFALKRFTLAQEG